MTDKPNIYDTTDICFYGHWFSIVKNKYDLFELYQPTRTCMVGLETLLEMRIGGINVYETVYSRATGRKRHTSEWSGFNGFKKYPNEEFSNTYPYFITLDEIALFVVHLNEYCLARSMHFYRKNEGAKIIIKN